MFVLTSIPFQGILGRTLLRSDAQVQRGRALLRDAYRGLLALRDGKHLDLAPEQ